MFTTTYGNKIVYSYTKANILKLCQSKIIDQRKKQHQYIKYLSFCKYQVL